MLLLKLTSLSRLILCLGFIYFPFVGYTHDILTNAAQSKPFNQTFVLDNTIMDGIDDPYMMPYYTGKILPTPQKAIYLDHYISLANTAIILNNIEQNDPRLKYLFERINRYGGNYELVTEANAQHTCVIKINDDSLTPPASPQGYVIQSNGKSISLKGSDFQGLLWAISSLNQMIFIRNGETVVRALGVIDWPDTEIRGMLPVSGNDIKQLAHLMVAFKLNLVDLRAGISKDSLHYDDWRLPRSDIFQQRLQELGERLTALSFEWYAGARFLGYDTVPQINISNEEDFNIIYNNFAVPIANAGGNLSVQFDDIRFPLHPDDIARFGTAVVADYYLLTKLYNKLKIDYPNIKIAFTPPFYWGPTSPNPYPESRDDYLNMLGTLPNAIDIYWTGPRVVSSTVSKEDVAWEVERIKRKPRVFQNAIGTPHDFDYHYMTDPIYSLNNWYYKNYLKDIKAYMLNGGDIDKSGAVVSIADWTWNFENFEPETTIKDAVMKLTGAEAYPILKDMNSELSKFDSYLLEVTIRAIIDSPLLIEALDNLENLNQQLQMLNGTSIEFWTSVNSSHIARVRHFVEQVYTASQDPIVQQIIDRDDASVTMYYAILDINFNPDTEILIEPEDFTGGAVLTYGYYNEEAGILLEDRPTAYITGIGTPTSEMTATFELNEYPASGNYQLILSGADDFLEEKCPIRITLNDELIFEGPNPFSNKEWNIQIAELPANIFERNNVLTIANISPNGNFDAPPAFMLNYVVLRK